MESASLPRYEYKPLKGPQWLRILKLSPAISEDDTVTCHLEHCVDTKIRPQTISGEDQPTDDDLDEDSSGYEAVSWCWGSGEGECSVTMMDNGKSYHFPVYQNLYKALKALRKKEKVRNLWVDAICINQTDLEERNQQVAKMNEVYGNATNVCVWLGQSTDKTTTALNFIRTNLRNLDSFDQLCKDKIHLSKWTAMLDLMKQEWFQRRWVVQEVSLARKATVYCGRDWVTWDEFCSAVSLFVDVDSSAQRLSELVKREEEFGYADDFFKEVPALGATSLVKVTNRLFKRSVGGFLQRTSSLEDIVAQLAMFESSEPRDTIYALLALAKDSQPSIEGIPDHLSGRRLKETEKKALTTIARLLPNPYRRSYVVNYNQEVVDVYQQFIAFAIAKTDPTRALDIICRPFAQSYKRADNVKFNRAELEKLSDVQKEELVALPSWIPNRSEVSFHKQKKPRRSSSLNGADVFSMERQRGDPFVSTPDSITYCAAGSKTYDKDKVRFRKRKDHYSMFVEGFILDTVDTVEPASQLGNIPGGWLAQRDKYRKTDKDTFWKTLVADRSPKGPAPLYYKNAIETALDRAPPHSTFNIQKYIQEATSEIVSGALRQVQDTIWERCLIVTKQGYLGLAPRSTQKHDVVCIVYGCSVPVIMRRIDKTDAEKSLEKEHDEQDRKERRDKLIVNVKRIFDKHKTKRQDARKSAANHTHILLAGIDLASQQALLRTASLTVMTCLISYAIHERLVASLLAALAFPHLIADILRSSAEHRLWRHDSRHTDRTFVVMVIVIICLGITFGSAWKCSAHAVVISGAFEALFPELLPTPISLRYRRFLTQALILSKRALDRNLADKQDTAVKLPSTEKKKEHPLDRGPLPCYYELVGESYIHGMMNGEAIELQNNSIGQDAQRIISQSFELR